VDKTLTLPHVLDHDTLKRLAAQSGGTCISVYLPTHRAGSEKEKDPILLKNLLRSAEEQLVAGGMRAAAADALLAEVKALPSDPVFWRDMGDGLALFVCDNDGSVQTDIVKVSVPLPSHTVTGDRFYLRPLIAAWRAPVKWALLAVDQNGSALYLGSNGSFEALALAEGVPLSLADELKYDVPEDSLQSHAPAAASHPSSGGHSQQTFHGHGGGKDVRDVNLNRWLTRLATGVAGRLAEVGNPPLMLAGVDYELDLFRAASSYPNLRAEKVNGSTARRTPAELRAAALAVLGPDVLGAPGPALAELREKEGSPLASHSVCDIVSAASRGRVKTLFFDESVGPFGMFDATTHECDVYAPAVPHYLRETKQVDDDVAPSEGTWDLVDLAVAETIRNGGDVHALLGEDPPVKGVAAIFRY